MRFRPTKEDAQRGIEPLLREQFPQAFSVGSQRLFERGLSIGRKRTVKQRGKWFLSRHGSSLRCTGAVRCERGTA